MNYSEIKALALAYADRSDIATSDNVDNFLKIVEARVNRKLRTMDMTTRQDVACITGTDYLDLPADFGGAREIKFRNSTGDYTPMSVVSPDYLDGLVGVARLVKIYYSIIGDQIRVMPVQETGDFIELAYFKSVPALTVSATTNWLSDSHPDCYVFGLMVEISAFVKDAEAKTLWENRFLESINDIEYDDAVSKHTGQALQARIG